MKNAKIDIEENVDIEVRVESWIHLESSVTIFALTKFVPAQLYTGIQALDSSLLNMQYYG